MRKTKRDVIFWTYDGATVIAIFLSVDAANAYVSARNLAEKCVVEKLSDYEVIEWFTEALKNGIATEYAKNPHPTQAHVFGVPIIIFLENPYKIMELSWWS